MSRTNPRQLPSQSYLHEVLDYYPDTGEFVWKKRPGGGRAINSWNGKHAGKIAGTLDPAGYLTIRLVGVNHFAHRLAWVYVYGSAPEHEVDHRNRLRHDNRIDNLRPATIRDNNANQALLSSNTSGFRGVREVRGRWRAVIGSRAHRKHLGYFDTAEEASKAYEAAAEKLYGQFRRNQADSKTE